MTEIVVPKLNNNDASYVLVEWMFEDGQQVPAGAAVALVETAKAVEELVAEKGGVLHRVRRAGEECTDGDLVGHLFSDAAERDRFLADAERSALPGDASADPVITEPARALIERHGVDLDRVRALGKRTIRRSDVEALLAGAGAGDEGVRRLSRNQVAIADVVSASHREIPAAFAAMKVDARAALHVRRDVLASGRAGFDILELVIAAVARLRADFPVCFASLLEGHTLAVPERAHVGVTVDTGNGLFVPVVHDADRKTPGEIAGILSDYRRRAGRGTLREQDMADGNISVSVTAYADVVLSVPVVLPPQVCMLSLCGIEHELRRERGGEIGQRPVFTLGMSYDHRVINGRDAVLFLRAVKGFLESSQRLAELVGGED
ncbi:2-oxo acid dehydrogenase subunit E2 [Gandjariella thermophila]|uniref:Dihydrolipoamide acetyltransferase component of pyruvate dehydrogenase complex n=1 Tax=Gandjariella thermophila TaxID=1931992 RepID=A0A4D4J882_9PSEU|nr:2-oxo acid dehydrogenase subunit E2 [Gandjariella thermophila]GDY31734.1 dihydrolipoamide acetyltransferase component of pyruvate dehydrogenase complex [Gandjariella thermophila]